MSGNSKDVFARLDGEAERHVEELKDYMRIPSISTDPAYRAEVSAPPTRLLTGWRMRLSRARARPAWPGAPTAAVRRHASGTTLAIAAPCDQLYTATELNEWALCATLHERDPAHWSGLVDALAAAALEAPDSPAAAFAPQIDEERALARLECIAAAERRPGLRALVDATTSRDLPWLNDDSLLTVGAGGGSRSFALDALPAPADVPWPVLHDVPTALVTGSNGKTTTVRLVHFKAGKSGKLSWEIDTPFFDVYRRLGYTYICIFVNWSIRRFI